MSCVLLLCIIQWSFLLQLLDRRSQDSTTVAVHEMSLCEAEAAIQTFLQGGIRFFKNLNLIQ